ncbi:sigma-70 family RNA polymerase sigma factor [Propionibacteriaceae bacterium Y2011]|uniref:sigma-70 family RNA polymerase sigma factor n=1 Tax=Microlunatus sp. Y2014 TaxID=3418488 RepID=UPI003B445266
MIGDGSPAPGDEGFTRDEFDRLHQRMLGIAYRMLGSWSDAEDVAAEAWLRWHEKRPADVADARAWLTTVATRISVDRWRTLSRRRESYVGPWLPEPVDPALLPHETAEQRETLAIGLLHLMERLTPDERAVFVLKYAFDHDFTEIGRMIGRTPQSCRQLGHRARAKLGRGAEPMARRSATVEYGVLQRLMYAVLGGHEAEVVGLLTDDAVLLTDGGGKVKSALLPILGPAKIYRFLAGVTRAGVGEPTFITVNTGPALLLEVNGDRRLFRIDVDGERISALHLYGNPDKMHHLTAAGRP